MSKGFQPRATALAIAVFTLSAAESEAATSTIELSATPNWSLSGEGAFSQFGYTAACAGDVNGDGYSDIIVGSPNQRANLYLGQNGAASSVPDWTSPIFVTSVSGAGDVNGDGYDDVIIGDAFNSPPQGIAQVYLGSPTGLSSTPVWTGDDGVGGAETAWYGYSVAGAGDVNGDGYSDVIVGAPQHAITRFFEGGAFLYFGGPSGPSKVPDWSDRGRVSFAQMGWSVSSAGDVNRDQYSDLLVGAVSRRAMVYHGSINGPAQTANWSEGSAAVSVAAAGDVNGDGFSDVIVGSPSFSSPLFHEGRALIFLGSPTGLFTTPHRILEGNIVNAGFGNSVSSAGDVNADGYSDIIIGAPILTNGQSQEGWAYVYLGSPAGIPADPAWTRESDQANANFGVTVTSVGDFNGDGFADVIVAADLMDEPGTEDQGRVEFYSGSGLTAGLNFAPLQVETQLHAPVALRGSTFNRSSFAITTNGYPQADGASAVWMQWEVKPLGVPFDDNDIQQTTAMPIGSRLKAVVRGLQFNTQYRWRARIASDHPTSPESVWFSIPGSNLTEAKIRGPRVSTLNQDG